jgi:hypothetical protein
MNELTECIHNGVSFSHKEECNYVVCRKRDRTRDYHVELNKSYQKRQISHLWNPVFKNELQECKTNSVWGWVSSEMRGEESERIRGEGRSEYGQSPLYA